MNNGRDCPHGRQVGKCDTCDLIRVELELEKVAADRDALAAQVVAFAAMIIEVRSADESKDFLGSDWHERSDGLMVSTPEQHLAAHDAEVAAKAVLDYNLQLRKDIDDKLPMRCIGVHGDEYAAQLRAKAGA